MDKDDLISGTIVCGGIALWAITSPIWVPLIACKGAIKAYHSLQDLKYKKDKDVINYPVAEDLGDFEMRRGIKNSPRWTRMGVGEVSLNSGKTAVYSAIFNYNVYPDKAKMIEIDGYKLNPRKVKRFPKNEKENIVSEVREKLAGRYDLEKIAEISCA